MSSIIISCGCCIILHIVFLGLAGNPGSKGEIGNPGPTGRAGPLGRPGLSGIRGPTGKS